MGEQKNQTDRQRLHDMLKGERSAMLVTRGGNGELRARPMAMAEVEGNEDIWFATSMDSEKISEMKANPSVNVNIQTSSKYISLSGNAIVTRDRAQIDRLWTEAWKIWFPKGKEDPALCLIQVQPTRGEFWDQTGMNKLEYMFEAVKAYVSGTEAKPQRDAHGSVKL